MADVILEAAADEVGGEASFAEKAGAAAGGAGAAGMFEDIKTSLPRLGEPGMQ